MKLRAFALATAAAAVALAGCTTPAPVVVHHGTVLQATTATFRGTAYYVLLVKTELETKVYECWNSRSSYGNSICPLLQANDQISFTTDGYDRIYDTQRTSQG